MTNEFDVLEMNEHAIRADIAALQNQMAAIEHNSNDILRALNIKPNQVYDAMFAMQKVKTLKFLNGSNLISDN